MAAHGGDVGEGMRKGSGSVYLAGRRVRLFKRHDRPSRYWQAAFQRDGEPRPLVKSTGQAELAEAKRWALDFLAGHAGGNPAPAAAGPGLRQEGPRREDLLAPYPFPRIRQKKRHVEREIALRTLSAYDHNPHIAQRSLARALDVSLAIVNAYTARCVRDGWLLKLERPRARGRGYRYVLTDAGRRQLHELLAAYLAQELSLFHALRADFRALLAAAGNRPVVLQGGGDLASIARLVLAEAGRAPLLELEGPPAAAQRARLRRHRDAVVWLTSLAVAPPAGHPVALPALLREFGPAVRQGTSTRAAAGKHVRSKAVV